MFSSLIPSHYSLRFFSLTFIFRLSWMAYMRSLSTRATLIARRCHPSFTYVLHDDDRKHSTSVEDLSPQRIDNFVQRRRPFGSSSFNKLAGFVPFLPDRGCSHVLLPSSFSPLFHRYMSTTVGDGSEKIEIMNDVAGVLTDTTIEAVASQASAVNEVAIAAADSYLPVQLLQYFIDAVHSFTGLNWRVSICNLFFYYYFLMTYFVALWFCKLGCSDMQIFWKIVYRV